MASVGIQLQFPQPPTILTRLETIPGMPLVGPGIFFLDRPRGPVNTDAFGFAWQFVTTPVGVGRTVGQNVTIFEQYLSVCLEVKSDITGTTLNGNAYFIVQDEGRQLFSEFPITRLSVWVAPATSIEIKWVLVL